MQVIFSEVGDLLRCSLHYDMSGRSKGTAEVVFALQTDALAAIKRYNNVQLDGKPLKIELVGDNVITPVPVLVTTTTNLAKPKMSLEGTTLLCSRKNWCEGRAMAAVKNWPEATARETPCREAYCRST
eukprot:XP_024462804.1 THO complex subunit 4B isoform X2 [Populus trichocarpa]